MFKLNLCNKFHNGYLQWQIFTTITNPDSPSQLPRYIGFKAATAILIGSVIGSGVFMKPSSMAAELGSPVWMSIAWIIAGLFSLAGALIFAELGALMPQTGGLYVYFRKIFGDFFAFLYGWSALAVMNTAAVAAITFVCAEYADHFLHLPRFDTVTEMSVALDLPFIGTLYPLENFGVKALAVAIILALTFMNTVSLKAGSAFQVVSTALKIGVIAALVFGIFFSGTGDTSNFIHAEEPATGFNLLTGMVIALTGAFFAYDGWVNVTYMAGEIKNPQRNIPRSLAIGVAATIVIYLLVNQAYLFVLPVEQVAASELVAADAIGRAWGSSGQNIIAAMIVICTLGAVNGNIFATPRVTYAMSRDGLFASGPGKEEKKHKTPANALWLHASWTIVLVISGSFNMLADMFVFVTWIAYMAGAIGMMKLRKTMGEVERPFKTPWYPVLPVVFILFTAAYLVITVISDVQNYMNGTQPVINSLLGLILTLAGIPFFYYYKRRRRKND
jgi:APA family basic amino acid/polyamine antiporter